MYPVNFVWLVLLSIGFINCSQTVAEELNFLRPLGSPTMLSAVDHLTIGSLDGATFDGLAWGWALDKDTPNESSVVHFYVDGNYAGQVTAQLLRPDVNLAHAVEGNHGFVFPIPPQFHDGKPHTLRAYAINTAGGTTPPIGEGTFQIVTTAPIGTIDGINANGSYWGWAFDRDNSNRSVTVHFYVDQHAGNLGRFEGAIGSTIANRPRPDVNQFHGITGDHGYEFSIPWYLRDGRTHTLYAYGIDTNGNTNSLLATQTFNVPPGASPGLRYLGYFASANDGVGMGDYTHQIADHTNVSWIGGHEIKKLQDASARNMKAVVDPFWYFFEFDKDNKKQLRADYLANWAELASQIKPYTNAIAAFYPMDEPYWDEPTYSCPMEIKSDLEKVIATIKADFPTTPVAVLFAVPCVTSDLIIPNGYDWVGFNCYGSFVDCGKPHHSVPWYATTLLSRMTPNQKLILAPDGWHQGSVCPSLPYQNELALRAEQYFSLALSEPRVIGLFTFIYQSFDSGTGTQCMPMVLDRWTRIGKTFKASIAGD